MFEISLETINQLKAMGKKTDYLEELYLNRKYQKIKPSDGEIDLFDENISSQPLYEVSEDEVEQLQLFGYVIDGHPFMREIVNGRQHLLDRLYAFRNQERQI